MLVVANPAFEEEGEIHMLENGEKINHAEDKSTNTSSESTCCLPRIRNALEAYLSKHRRAFKMFGLVLINLLVIAYLGVASAYWVQYSSNCDMEWCDGYGMLVLLLVFTYAGIFYFCVVKRFLGKSMIRCCSPISSSLERLRTTKYGTCIGKTAFYLAILIAIVIFLIFDTVGSRDRLISATGVVVLMGLGWIFSKYPGQINWRPVIWGLILQFVFGLATIRWATGRAIFNCISLKVVTFLEFAKDGASFVFSEKIVTDGVFAFAVLPVIFFFSFMIQILYYLGVMQWVIMKLGWALQSVMGTTLCESLNCAANTFIGMSESPLLIRPYISRLTSSELHAIMCSGFATVSGTVLAAYIGFGAQPAHLLTASIMSAPAALCYSKLFYPETEKSLTSLGNIELQKSQDSGILDAATKGALAGIPMVLGIVANIVAFVSFVAFLNALLSWLGTLVGYDGLTFEFILAKVFMPLSWIMGVPWEECEDVGALIGLKTVVNEFIAYQRMGEYKRAEKLSGRAEAIATYAICGFSNPSSIGIMLGALSSLAPEKREQIAAVIVRAFVAGSAVCFLTASIAGMLMDDDFFESALDKEIVNSTIASVI